MVGGFYVQKHVSIADCALPNFLVGVVVMVGMAIWSGRCAVKFVCALSNSSIEVFEELNPSPPFSQRRVAVPKLALDLPFGA